MNPVTETPAIVAIMAAAPAEKPKKPYLGIPVEPKNPMVKAFRDRLKGTRSFHQAAMSSGNRKYLGIGYEAGWADAVAYINQQAEQDITETAGSHEDLSEEGNVLVGIDLAETEDE